MMKVLLLSTGLGLGGAEKIVTSLADQLFVTGHEVKIAYLTGEIELRPQHTEIELISLQLDSLRKLVKSIFMLKKLIQKFQPDVVHAHMFHAILLARLARKYIGFPRLICTAHSKAVGGKVRQFLYRITDAASDINSNVSEEATQHFIQQHAFRADNAYTVSNGIDTEKFQFSKQARLRLRQQFSLSDTTPVLIAVGRLMEAKDYPNLIQAFAKVHTTVSQAQLFIVGEGNLRPQLQQLVQSLRLQQQIHFLGVRHDIADLLSMADLFVLSSAWEGFGLVVAEAMSCQRIVIATDCGGVKEVLGDAAWLVEPANAQMLGNKIVQGIQLSTEQRKQLGQQHRQRIVQYYAVAVMVEQWLKLYNNPLEGEI
ncbi:MAG: glycosyltransferase [Acinetobacter sp.]